MTKFYFTFGFGQPHENCYTIIEAEDWGTAHRQMVQKFGNKWSMQYESAEEAGVEKFNLREIK
jgi:hypothetical protein